MNNIIEVKNFTKKYGDFKAVDDISFEVAEGSIFAFLGPNGAGKSTTINTLCTIVDKTEGVLKINGYEVSDNKSKVRNSIGIVFQDSTLDGKLTVEENLKFHCEFYNVPKKDIKNRIDFVLDLVDLVEWRKAPVQSLSGGMKRRVEIARGLVHYPKVLFLDEPTTGLDPQTRANIWEYIYKLQKQKNITIFLTTHYMDEAEICDKVAIMDHGKIVAFDTPYNLKKEYTSNITKIKTSKIAELIEHLKNNSIDYDFDNDVFTIHSNKLETILEMTARFKNEIIDFETKKGTLNDVFLTITGKEIRL
ncbi:ABC transporter ATP-binding protein [Clostridium folliculivorans]|uniref:Daunorubicin resistance protein DrrA family ABC transporter ATP-binding protein n=1 Tax=Clostridium folliculivorans TaxID=2886038 RepID=A0A9W5Y113_9CLOT|nr:ATP-binding cassette domain-containing protein [Clostridium folliculivorans]GKU24640.1 daunorubicin resistance protein DrrA family ABC transporter ATP-binding protein [Clostridium folliculivorans]GKU30738.1 daunorubicin resistance protein DrrA family ABC transporter ATP-binding protein [Clostridium folliculivorans]